MESFENLSGPGGKAWSPEESARVEHEIADEQKELVRRIKLLSPQVESVDEGQLDDTQHPIFLEIKSTLEEAVRLSAHA